MIEGENLQSIIFNKIFSAKGIVNCQNSQDMGPPEWNSVRG